MSQESCILRQSNDNIVPCQLKVKQKSLEREPKSNFIKYDCQNMKKINLTSIVSKNPNVSIMIPMNLFNQGPDVKSPDCDGVHSNLNGKLNQTGACKNFGGGHSQTNEDYLHQRNTEMMSDCVDENRPPAAGSAKPHTDCLDQFDIIEEENNVSSKKISLMTTRNDNSPMVDRRLHVIFGSSERKMCGRGRHG